VEFSYPPHRIVVNVPTRAALLAEVSRRLRAGRGFALATINLDHLVKLRRDPAFAAAYAAQDLVVADGNPIVWLSRLARRPVQLVPGSDLIVPLAQAAAGAGVSVALLGSTQPALAAAAEGLRAQVPGLGVAALIAPPMGFDPAGPGADLVLEEVRASGAGLVFLALGAPKQERLAARGRAALPGVGFASIGAGLDFIAGSQTRAPAWVRAIAMEWLWRMLSNPRRLARRYAECALILPDQAVAAFRLRNSDKPE
jgi:N-acetylglucosaminyldiphosphoundecaprenol N-acetyl-beta-D-mannosaminyltransferase